MILLDTHVVLWLTTDPGNLSVKAKSAIEDARKNGDGLAISDITLLELVRLSSKGRIHLGITLGSLLREIEARFVVLPISSRACARAMGFPTAYPRSSGSHYRGHRTGRGAFSDYSGPSDPSLQSG